MVNRSCVSVIRCVCVRVCVWISERIRCIYATAVWRSEPSPSPAGVRDARPPLHSSRREPGTDGLTYNHSESDDSHSINVGRIRYVVGSVTPPYCVACEIKLFENYFKAYRSSWIFSNVFDVAEINLKRCQSSFVLKLFQCFISSHITNVGGYTKNKNTDIISEVFQSNFILHITTVLTFAKRDLSQDQNICDSVWYW